MCVCLLTCVRWSVNPALVLNSEFERTRIPVGGITFIVVHGKRVPMTGRREMGEKEEGRGNGFPTESDHSGHY